MPTDKQCIMHSEKINDIEIRQIKIESDIDHIRERVDNGLSKTICSVDKKFDALNLLIIGEVMPAIKDSTEWVGRIKKFVWWMATGSIVSGVGYIVFLAVKKGFQL